MNKLRLSFTQIEAVQKCEMMYYYKYILGLYPRAIQPRMQLGLGVHEALQYQFARKPEKRSSKVLRHYYDKSFAEAQNKLEALKTLDEESLFYQNLEIEMKLEYDRGLRALSEYWQQYHEDSEIPRITTELPGEVDMGDYILVFRLDGIFADEDGSCIVETKTQNNLDLLGLEAYEMQTQLYMAALRRVGVDVQDVLYNVIELPNRADQRSKKKTKVIRKRVSRTKTEIDWVEKVAHATYLKIQRLYNFYEDREPYLPPVPAFNKWNCNRCDYEPINQAFKKGSYVDDIIESLYDVQQRREEETDISKALEVSLVD